MSARENQLVEDLEEKAQRTITFVQGKYGFFNAVTGHFHFQDGSESSKVISEKKVILVEEVQNEIINCPQISNKLKDEVTALLKNLMHWRSTNEPSNLKSPPLPSTAKAVMVVTASKDSPRQKNIHSEYAEEDTIAAPIAPTKPRKIKKEEDDEDNDYNPLDIKDHVHYSTAFKEDVAQQIIVADAHLHQETQFVISQRIDVEVRGIQNFRTQFVFRLSSAAVVKDTSVWAEAIDFLRVANETRNKFEEVHNEATVDENERRRYNRSLVLHSKAVVVEFITAIDEQLKQNEDSHSSSDGEPLRVFFPSEIAGVNPFERLFQCRRMSSPKMTKKKVELQNAIDITGRQNVLPVNNKALAYKMIKASSTIPNTADDQPNTANVAAGAKGEDLKKMGVKNLREKVEQLMLLQEATAVAHAAELLRVAADSEIASQNFLALPHNAKAATHQEDREDPPERNSAFLTTDESNESFGADDYGTEISTQVRYPILIRNNTTLTRIKGVVYELSAIVGNGGMSAQLADLLNEAFSLVKRAETVISHGIDDEKAEEMISSRNGDREVEMEKADETSSNAKDDNVLNAQESMEMDTEVKAEDVPTSVKEKGIFGSRIFANHVLPLWIFQLIMAFLPKEVSVTVSEERRRKNLKPDAESLRKISSYLLSRPSTIVTEMTKNWETREGVNKDHYFVEYAGLLSMKEGVWFNCSAMNGSLGVIRRRFQEMVTAVDEYWRDDRWKVLMYETFISTNIIGEDQTEDYVYSYDRTKRWNWKKNGVYADHPYYDWVSFAKPFLASLLIFIAHLGKNHWAAFFLFPRIQIGYLADSQLVTPKTQQKRIKLGRSYVQWLFDELKAKGTPEDQGCLGDQAKWKYYQRTSGNQRNSNDCGPFALKAIEEVLEEVLFRTNNSALSSSLKVNQDWMTKQNYRDQLMINVMTGIAQHDRTTKDHHTGGYIIGE